MSSFFEEPPKQPPEEPHIRPRWARQSSRWLLAPLTADAVLARTTTVVLYVYLVRACPDGFAFRLLAAPAEGHRLNFFSFVMSRWHDVNATYSPSASPFANTPFADMFGRSSDPLKLGVELADGTPVSHNEAFEAVREEREPRGFILAGPSGGSSGGDNALTAEWIVSPLPKADATLVVEWGDEGVSRVSHVISSRQLADAAAKAVRLARSNE